MTFEEYEDWLKEHCLTKAAALAMDLHDKTGRFPDGTFDETFPRPKRSKQPTKRDPNIVENNTNSNRQFNAGRSSTSADQWNHQPARRAGLSALPLQ
jgi:hypothetical protein